MKITSAMLRKHRACADQVTEFQRRFGKSVEVTEEICLSVAKVFNWNWAALYFLPAPARKAYDEATVRKAYDEEVAPAWKSYQEARAQAFARAAK